MDGLNVSMVRYAPFAAGVFLFGLFSALHVPIGWRLIDDLGFDGAELGLLAFAFGLAVVGVQVPAGVAADQYGPARVQGVGLGIATAGLVLLAIGTDVVVLALARVLVGLGVGGTLVAGLKAIAQNLHKDQAPRSIGALAAAGALGAITAFGMLESVLAIMSWRELYLVLAIFAAAVALLIVLMASDPAKAAGTALFVPKTSLKEVLVSDRFWRLAPVSAALIGSAWALLSFSLAAWSRDLPAVERSQTVADLLTLASAFGGGAVLCGVLLGRLRQAGYRPHALLVLIAGFAIATTVTMAALGVVGLFGMGLIMVLAGGAMVLTYSILGTIFPKEVAGRANGLVTLLHLGTAWALQSLAVWEMGRWPQNAVAIADVGATSAILATIGGLQMAALLWFWRPWTLHRPQRITTPTRVLTVNQRLKAARGLGWRPAAAAGALAALVFVMSNRDWVSETASGVADAPVRLQSSLQIPNWLFGNALPDTASQSVINDQVTTIRSLQARLYTSERELGAVRPQLDDLNRQVKHLQELAKRSASMLAVVAADAVVRREVIAGSVAVASPVASAAAVPEPVRTAAIVLALPRTSGTPAAAAASVSPPARASVFAVVPPPPAKVIAAKAVVTSASVLEATQKPAAAAGATCERAGASEVPLLLQFDRNKDTLEFGHHKTLNEIVAIAIGCPGASVEIKGFSDNRGSPKLKTTLSQRRAELTATFLEVHGVKPDQLTVVAMADRAPVDTNDTDAGRARNRRVEVRVRLSN